MFDEIVFITFIKLFYASYGAGALYFSLDTLGLMYLLGILANEMYRSRNITPMRYIEISP